MFLKAFSDEEKRAFLSLANKLMISNGFIDKQQSSLINQLKEEMEFPESLNDIPEEDSLKILQKSENKIKRSVYIELLSLAIAGELIDNPEEIYLQEIKKNLGLPDSFTNDVLDWYKKYISTTQEGINLVKGI